MNLNSKMDFSRDEIKLTMSDELDRLQKRYFERIEKHEKRIKACEMNTIVQSKLAEEQKIHDELTKYLAELSKRKDNLDKICANFATGLTISDRDQQRLDNAQQMYDLIKQMTGVRFDLSAPPDVVRGYIKSDTNHTLTRFSIKADEIGETGEAIWSIIKETCLDKENRQRN